MPQDAPFQVLHFWDDDGAFGGWYVNFDGWLSDIGDWPLKPL